MNFGSTQDGGHTKEKGNCCLPYGRDSHNFFGYIMKKNGIENPVTTGNQRQRRKRKRKTKNDPYLQSAAVY